MVSEKMNMEGIMVEMWFRWCRLGRTELSNDLAFTRTHSCGIGNEAVLHDDRMIPSHVSNKAGMEPLSGPNCGEAHLMSHSLPFFCGLGSAEINRDSGNLVRDGPDSNEGISDSMPFLCGLGAAEQIKDIVNLLCDGTGSNEEIRDGAKHVTKSIASEGC